MTGIGIGAPGLGAPLPGDYATDTHVIVVRILWPDGSVQESRSAEQPGSAAASHERLAKRWKAARTTFERDKKALC